jgi:hypothetical protein
MAQSMRVWDMDSGECLHRVETASPVLAVAYYLSELEGKRTVDPAAVLGPCRVNVKLTYEYDSTSSRHTVCATVLRAQGVPKGGVLGGGVDTGTYVVAELGEESERSQDAPAWPNPAWNLVALFGPPDLTNPLLLKIFRPSPPPHTPSALVTPRVCTTVAAQVTSDAKKISKTAARVLRD